MALNASVLRDLLISSMSQTDSHDNAHQWFANAVNSHVTGNMDIRGYYEGTTGGGSHVSGTYWFDATCLLSWVVLRNGGQACTTYNGPWVSALQAEMRTNTTVNSPSRNGYLRHNGRDFSPLNIAINFVSSNNISQFLTMQYVAQRIVQAYTSTSLPNTDGHSIQDNSTGTINWQLIQ